MDNFRNHGDAVSSPARRCFVITPNDVEPLPFVTKSIRADGDGVITLRAIDSEVDVAHPVISGERIDVRISHVRAAGTSGQTIIIGYA